jgi:serine/threonine protein phosphatase PrpC
MQGWRNTQEDSHIAETSKLGPDLQLFGVFDGHGGHEVAEWVRDHYVDLLIDLPSFQAGEY